MQEIKDLFEKGESLRSIARQIGKPYHTVRATAQELGLYIPHRKNFNGTCRRCHKKKSLEHFPDSNLRNSKYVCRECTSKKNHEHQIEKLGCSVEMYEALLARQNNVCAICGSKVGHVTKRGTEARLAVDHDHRTGEIRGLLCNRCNRGLGYLEDCLQSAIEYIKGHHGRKKSTKN